MPIERCQRNGQPGWRWGSSGKCYVYTPNDKASRNRAKQKALEQGRAILARQTSSTTELANILYDDYQAI